MIKRMLNGLAGNWLGSFKWHLIFFIPILALFWYTFKNGYFPNDAKTLQDRGWHQGFFLTRLGLFWYIVVYFFVIVPVQELVFRKFMIEKGLDILNREKFWIINLVQATLFSLLRIIYPFPLGIVTLSFIMGIMFGYDYYNNRSVVTLWIFHFTYIMMGVSVNLL